jgi:glutathione S-transferase
LSAFEELPCYIASRSDYYTHVHVMPSQNGPGYMVSQAKPIAFQICGLSGGTWNLSLHLEDDSLEHFPNSSFCNPPNAYKPTVEAAFASVNNHVNITRFACRGAGNPGKPSFHAELADPYAEPNESYFQAVDVCLRHVTHALVEGIDHDSSPAHKDLAGMAGNVELRENWEAYPDDHDPSLTYYWNCETGEVTWTPPTQQLDTCLAYLRDRIGVPRDMSAAAAMHLRAYLNWAIQHVKKENAQ